jgi:hypothetical protein
VHRSLQTPFTGFKVIIRVFFHLWFHATLGFGNAMVVRKLQILFFAAFFGDLNCRQFWHFLVEESGLELFVHYIAMHH